MFVKLCELKDVAEGEMRPVGAGFTLVLVVWPKGGDLRVLQGVCPHAGELLLDAHFDGQNLTCRAHDWIFDASTGACTFGRPCTLVSYPHDIRGQEIFADLEDTRPNLLRR